MYLCRLIFSEIITSEIMLNAELQWVAVYTKSRTEKKVLEKFVKAGYVCYLPMHRELHKWSDRNKWVEVPLFKSYVFVKITDTDVSNIRNIDEVVAIISFGGKIAIVPDSEINAIKRILAEENEFVVKSQSSLRKNSHVRVIGGPFKDMEGVLLNNCKDGNFSVQIEALSASIVMTIDRQLLEFVPESDSTTHR